VYRRTSVLLLAALIGVLGTVVWCRFGPRLVETFRAQTRAQVSATAQPIGGAPATEVIGPTRLGGVPPTEVGERRLRGKVTMPDGASAAIFVYLLPKGVEGADDVDAVAQLDGAGRFDLGVVDPRGHWIAAKAAGLVPAFVDGDTCNGRDPVLALEAGREIRVRVRAEGGMPADVRAVCAPPQPSRDWAFPGPAAAANFRAEVPIADGAEHSVRVPTWRQVRVHVVAADRRLDPPQVVLAPKERLASFRLWRIGRLRVNTTDAETGASLDDDAVVTVLSLATGREVVSRSATLLAHWMEDEGLRLGTYAVLVRAPGYVPASVPEVAVDDGPEATPIEVPLTLDPAAGVALIACQLPQGRALTDEVVHVEGRRTSARTCDERTWQTLEPRAVDRTAATLKLAPLPLGDWEILVWAGARLVGRTSVQVRGGFPDKTSVTLDTGLLADLAQVLPDASPDADGGLVELRAPDGDPLPALRFRSAQPAAIGLGGRGVPSDVVERSALVPPDAVLGPYPVREIQVRGLTGEDWQTAGRIHAE